MALAAEKIPTYFKKKYTSSNFQLQKTSQLMRVEQKKPFLVKIWPTSLYIPVHHVVGVQVDVGDVPEVRCNRREEWKSITARFKSSLILAEDSRELKKRARIKKG